MIRSGFTLVTGWLRESYLCLCVCHACFLPWHTHCIDSISNNPDACLIIKFFQLFLQWTPKACVQATPARNHKLVEDLLALKRSHQNEKSKRNERQFWGLNRLAHSSQDQHSSEGCVGCSAEVGDTCFRMQNETQTQTVNCKL